MESFFSIKGRIRRAQRICQHGFDEKEKIVVLVLCLVALNRGDKRESRDFLCAYVVFTQQESNAAACECHELVRR